MLKDAIKLREKSYYDTLARYPDYYRFHADEKLSRYVWDSFLAIIDAGLFKGKRVIEVSCGDGRFLPYFKSCQAAIVIGSDISYEYMSTLKKREELFVSKTAYKINLHDFFLVQADSEFLPFKNSSFDIIFINRALHHLSNKEAFFKDAHRILDKDGIVIIHDPNGANMLRRFADIFGKSYGILSSDEKSLSVNTLKGDIIRYNFRIIQSLNCKVFSEIVVHLEGIIYKKSRHIARLLQFFNPFFLRFDSILERFLCNSKRFCWMWLLIIRKV